MGHVSLIATKEIEATRCQILRKQEQRSSETLHTIGQIKYEKNSMQ